MLHFENLWDEAEKLLAEETNISTWHELSLELIRKSSMLDQMDQLGLAVGTTTEEDRRKLKTKVMGSLLLVLTQLSLKDNINVFAALKAAIEDRKISIFEERYK